MNTYAKIGSSFFMIFLLVGCSLFPFDQDKKIAGDSVVIALVYSKTGADSVKGEQFFHSTLLAQKEINNHGGINGKQLTFTVQDSENNPAEGKNIAAEIVKRDDVLAVIVDSSNNIAEEAAPIYEDAHITQITPIAASEKFTSLGNYQFSAFPPRSMQTSFDVEYIIAKGLHYKSVAVIYENSDWGSLALDSLEKTAMRNGIQVRVKEPIANGQTQYNDILSRIRQTNPECVYVLGNYDEMIKILQTIRIKGWDIPVIVTSSYLTYQAENVIGTSLGTVVSQRLSALDHENTEMENFIYEYRDVKKYSDIEFGMRAYDTVKLAAEAARNCGDELTRTRFREELEHLHDFKGLLGSITFDEMRIAHRKFYVVQHQRVRWDTLITTEDLRHSF